MIKIDYKIENRSCIAILIDGEFWRKGDITILGKKPDLPGQCNSIEELESLYKVLEYQGAKRYAYKRLALKSMPSYELANLLAKKHISESVCNTLIEELTRQGYLNDKDWAEAYVKYQSHKKYGPKAILHKLRAKGYKNSDHVIASVSAPDVQSDSILKIISTRYRSRDFSDPYEKNKVIAALVRKGYDLDIILKTISHLKP
jgi:regulatory protein